MMEENIRPGKCRWMALILVILLFQGLLPAAFIGGAAGLKTAELLEHGGSELIGRLFTLIGMILGLMVSSVILMFLVETVKRIVLLLPGPAPLRSSLTTANPEMSEEG